MAVFGNHLLLDKLFYMVSDYNMYDYGHLSTHNTVIYFTGRINLPEPDVLPDDTSRVPVPYVFVADEAFPLKPYLMRPFPGRQLDSNSKRIYNYSLSRARRVVENAFGMLLYMA